MSSSSLSSSNSEEFSNLAYQVGASISVITILFGIYAGIILVAHMVQIARYRVFNEGNIRYEGRSVFYKLTHLFKDEAFDFPTQLFSLLIFSTIFVTIDNLIPPFDIKNVNIVAIMIESILPYISVFGFISIIFFLSYKWISLSATALSQWNLRSVRIAC
eukprot:gb/GECH01014274.1/.p1 GENE.gb/GECH01014274.1/~~gb/GECH01014274.1/.p1  ORF type:complete len:160 (+),score=25.93 gb/GECH01014274.1/:1-480(+)